MIIYEVEEYKVKVSDVLDMKKYAHSSKQNISQVSHKRASCSQSFRIRMP